MEGTYKGKIVALKTWLKEEKAAHAKDLADAEAASARQVEAVYAVVSDALGMSVGSDEDSFKKAA
jgi:hypothetical protein